MSRIRRYFFPKQLHADPQVRIGTIRFLLFLSVMFKFPFDLESVSTGSLVLGRYQR